jgi:serine/threonine-protein kinase RsbW
MNDASFIVVSSELSNVNKIVNWLENNLFEVIKDKEKRSIFTLVIKEAIVNAIIHGNKEDKEKNVTVSYNILNQDLHVNIQDEGNGIPVSNKIKENINDEDLLKESGRGIILMKHLCKDVIFNKTSIELIMEL